MNDTNPTETPAEPADGGSKLDAAKRTLASLAEKAKEHDFKGDARKAATPTHTVVSTDSSK